MSARTRRAVPHGTDDTHPNSSTPATTTTTTNLKNEIHNAGLIPNHPADVHEHQQHHHQRKRRLDVDPDNIIQAESGSRLKRRRSPSVPPGGEIDGNATITASSPEQVAERREKARVKGKEMYDAVMYEQTPDGRFLASEFIGLPNKRQFPDYYALIKHPMSLSVIEEKLFQTAHPGANGVPPSGTSLATGSTATHHGSAGLKVKLRLNGPNAATAGTAVQGVTVQGEEEKYEGYRDLDEVKRDFDLIWGNAKRYNQKESGIYTDAQRLHKLTNHLYREATHSAIDQPHPSSDNNELMQPMVATSDVKEEDQKDGIRPTKKIKLGINPQRASGAVSSGLADKDKDVHMSEPESEFNLSKLIKAGNKRIETAQAGSPPRKIADFFMALPSKKDYPDYYLFIKMPISLKEIRNKAEKNKYETIEDWARDVTTMCDNAKFYNEPGSLVHSNAEEVEKLLTDIVKDAYKRLGITPPVDAQLPSGPKLKFNVVKSAEPSPAPVLPSHNPTPIAAPSPVPPVSTPKIQLKAPAPHNEKPRAPMTPRIPSGGAQTPSTPAPRPAVMQRSSSGATPYAPPTPVARPNASPFPPQISTPKAGPSLPSVVNTSTPSPRLSTVAPPTPHRPASQIGTTGPSAHFQSRQPLAPGMRPANSPAPTMPRPPMPIAKPPSFPSTPPGPMPNMTPGHPQRHPLHTMPTTSVPPRANPAPPPPRPQAPVVPLVRRPLPALPMIESMDFAFDAAGSSGGKQLKTVRLRNQRGVTNHSTSIRQETTRLEIIAHLGKQATATSTDGSAMDIDSPVAPAVPNFSLKYEGRRISGTTLPMKPGGAAGGCKWDVPVTSRSALSTIEITVDKPQSGRIRRGETYLIFVGRQS